MTLYPRNVNPARASRSLVLPPGAVFRRPTPRTGQMQFNPFAKLNLTQITDLRHNDQFLQLERFMRMNPQIRLQDLAHGAAPFSDMVRYLAAKFPGL